MHLVEILLPVRDNHGQPFSHEKFQAIGERLTDRFGGLTAFTRAPAEGFWHGDNQRRLREDVIVLEVMVDHHDRKWWKAFRIEMETAFAQDEVVIRTQAIERL
jgi:hypothetical protein